MKTDDKMIEMFYLFLKRPAIITLVCVTQHPYDVPQTLGLTYYWINNMNVN